MFLNDSFDGLTEARPGNYGFMDLIQVVFGVAQPHDVALQVLAPWVPDPLSSDEVVLEQELPYQVAACPVRT